MRYEIKFVYNGSEVKAVDVVSLGKRIESNYVGLSLHSIMKTCCQPLTVRETISECPHGLKINSCDKCFFIW